MRCTGDWEGDGVEDEQAPVQQDQHAQRDPTDEQTEASQHTEVPFTHLILQILIDVELSQIRGCVCT